MTALELLKSVEDRESLYLIITDNAYKCVMVAWTHYRPQFKDTEIGPKEPQSQWFARLWDSVGDVDFVKLSSLAGIPFNITREKFDNLKRMALIYPDGSMSVNAANLIRAEVGAHISALMPRPAYQRPPRRNVPKKKKK